MQSIVSAVLSAQSLLALVALATALYAGYDLLRLTDWWRRPVAAAARVWIFGALGLVAVETLVFESNAVLALAYKLGAPLNLVQAGFVVTLIAAGLVWMRE